MRHHEWLAAAGAFMAIVLAADSAIAQPSYVGTWSTTATMSDDPEWYPEDYYCFFGCTRVQIEHLRALIDDPANDALPLEALMGEASELASQEFTALLTKSAREEIAGRTIVDSLDEVCLRYGHFGMTVSVMPLRITDEGDKLILAYETHNTSRTIYKRDSAPLPPNEPSRLGYSIAHYDGNDLVIETTGVENTPLFVAIARGLRHSDQMRTTERYSLSEDGQTLDMIFTVEDPELLVVPWVWIKKWRLAPHLQLQHHEYDCSFVPGQR